MAQAKKNTPKEPVQDRDQAVREALARIEKSYGKGSVIQMDSDYVVQVDGISTGSLSLDLALGGRGLPRGRIIELYGPEGSGKSTLALSVVAQAQAQGGYAVFIDAEHAFDPEYAKRMGVQLDGLRFNLSQPSYGEEGLDIAEQFVKSGAVDIVVVDSVAALVPKAEIDGEIGDQFVGLQARMMSQALRRLTGAVGKSRCIVLFINQLREKIGVMFGNPETTPGGRALKFYASVRVDVRRIGAIKQGDQIIGNRTKATVVKNKVAPPFRRAEFDILYGQGISQSGDLLDLGLQYGLVVKAGSWFSFRPPQGEELRLGQGREMARQLLEDNPELAAELRRLVVEVAMPVPPAAKTIPEGGQGIQAQEAGQKEQAGQAAGQKTGEKTEQAVEAGAGGGRRKGRSASR